MVAFPDLHRESTLEVSVVGAVSAVAGGLLLGVSWVLGAVALIPCGVWLLHAAWLGILNARLRYRWSRQFRRRVSGRQLRVVVKGQPGRFRVHVRFFGGFDMAPICPAVVLEDRSSGELTAVYPGSWRVPEVCEQLGVEVVCE
jgi:hypothetical protein